MHNIFVEHKIGRQRLLEDLLIHSLFTTTTSAITKLSAKICAYFMHSSFRHSVSCTDWRDIAISSLEVKKKMECPLSNKITSCAKSQNRSHLFFTRIIRVITIVII